MTLPRFPLSLITRDLDASVLAVRDQIAEFLAEQPAVQVVTSVCINDLPPDFGPSKLVLALGGDGTILRTCRHLGQSQLPILGVNLGRLGFLADLSPADFCRRFTELARGDYRVVDHLMFECVVLRDGREVLRTLGLNEAAILAGAALRMISIEVAIDGETVATYSGDGVIISTPIGSTAYNLAAGGPILRQDLQAFVVTPVSPHTLTHRPLVERADGEYRLQAPSMPEGTTLVIDGQIRFAMSPRDCVVIRRATVSCQLVRLKGHSYYATLHGKLGWGDRPAYRQGRQP